MQLATQPGTHRNRLLALVTCACVVGGLATAQQMEVAGTARSGPATVPPSVLPAAGAAASTKAILYDNGPYITQTGVGCNGGDVSELEAGLSIYGYGHQQQSGFRVADDFVVTGGSWTIERLKWKAYQTGAPTSGTITGITINLYDDSPSGGGVSIAGDDTTDRLLSTTWTGVYRVTSSTLPDCNRAVIEATADMTFTGTLPPDDYWLSVACDGSLPSGPWANPTVPWDNSDNGEEYVGGFWAPLTGGQGNGGVDFPFVLEGPTCSVTYYCTSRPSSLPNCTPSLAAGCTASVSAGPGSYDIYCGPVPGGSFPAVIIHTPHGARNPAQPTQFGHLCINSPFWRGDFAMFPGGTSGVCDGTYVADFGDYMQRHAPGRGLVPGNSCDLQFWYRDPGNSGSANFTEAMSFLLTP